MRSEAQASDKPYVRLATRADAIELAPNLREEDLKEIAHGTGLSPEHSLRYALAISSIAYAVMWRGRVVALFGVVPEMQWEDGLGKGFPWMLASDDLKHIRKSFLKECRGYVQGWLKVHQELEGYVWAENEVHIQWLRWLGFQFDEPAPYGINKQPFLRFHMKEDHV